MRESEINTLFLHDYLSDFQALLKNLHLKYRLIGCKAKISNRENPRIFN